MREALLPPVGPVCQHWGMTQDIEIRDNPEAGRFETTVEGETAVLEYVRDPGRLRLVHTGVPSPLEGRGIGSRLARHALDRARADGLDVWPDCPFVAVYIRRHPEYLDLVPDDFPRRDRLER
jgi:predicted GNAT family acetyltransferase